MSLIMTLRHRYVVQTDVPRAHEKNVFIERKTWRRRSTPITDVVFTERGKEMRGRRRGPREETNTTTAACACVFERSDEKQ